MFIYKVNEGERNHFGLNWRSNKRTFFSFILRLPIWPILPTYYHGFDTDNYYYGWRIRIFSFYFRIRRWKTFPSHMQKILYGFNLNIYNIKNRQLICNREMIKDNKCNLITGY